MTNDIKRSIAEFIQNCEDMDWDNMANLTICLENAIHILKDIVLDPGNSFD